MVRRIFFILSVCFVLIAGDLVAQEVTIERSQQTEIIDGKYYYIHKVTKGQTLYSIAKAYEVSVDEILFMNPDAKSAISINQLLKIPFSAKKDAGIADALNVATKGDSNYILHTVKSSETLFSISRNYNVVPADVLKINEGLTERIIPGQIIKIPVNKQEILPQPVIAEGKADFFIHTVQKKETLYSIAKAYLVSLDEIRAINPGLDEKIKQGQGIRIPASSKKEVAVKPADSNSSAKKTAVDAELYCKSPSLSTSYNVAMMIPFFLNKAGEVHVPENDAATRNFKSLNFIEFYEGALMAVDSMKRRGMNLNLYVYDDPNDSSFAAKIIAKPEMSKMDLFIGPFFRSSFKVFDDFAGNNNINLVNPVSPRDELVEGNPNVFKVVPSNYTQFSELAEYLVKDYPGANVIVVNNQNNKELQAEAEFLKNAVNVAYFKNGVKDTVCRLVHYFNTGLQSVTSKLKSGTPNIVITLATGEVFYTSYIRSLRTYAETFNVTLITQPYIRKYESLEIEYMQQLKLNVFSSSFIDYSDNDVKKFVASFREKYNTDPDSLAFAGYDITMFFLNALFLYGRNFQHCVNATGYKPLHLNFKFLKREEGSGYENQTLCVYKFEDFKLVKVK